MFYKRCIFINIIRWELAHIRIYVFENIARQRVREQDACVLRMTTLVSPEGFIPSKLHTDFFKLSSFSLTFGQALDLLVTVSSMYYYTSTSALSTL